MHGKQQTVEITKCTGRPRCLERDFHHAQFARFIADRPREAVLALAGMLIVAASTAFCQQLPGPRTHYSVPSTQYSLLRTQHSAPGNQYRLKLASDDAPEPLPPPTAQPSLSLAELEQLGLQNNPSLGRAAALVAAARGNWLQVGLPPNPTVGYEGQQLGSGGQAEQHGVVFGQEIVRGGKLRLNRAVAAQEVVRAEHELAIQQQRVLTDVRIAFFQVLLAQRQIEITAELLRISQQTLDIADALFRATEGTRIDILQAQLERENAHILAENARNRHQAAWQSLTAVVGLPGLACQPLVGNAYAAAHVYCLPDILQRLHSTSPEVGVALANIDRARYSLQRARAEPRPNVNFQGLVNWIDNDIGGKPDAAVAVTVPLPLWNRNQGAILKAEHELAAAQQALGQLELDLQERLAPAFEHYANARNQVERYRTRILPAAQQSLELTRKIYAAGEINYVSLLTVQRTFSQTNLSHLEALRELRTAEAEIEGLLLSRSLQAR